MSCANCHKGRCTGHCIDDGAKKRKKKQKQKKSKRKNDKHK